MEKVILVLEFLKAVLLAVIMSIIGAFKALVPTSLLTKKSVAQEIILITGAGSGLGRMMALRFAKLGARLVLWDVNTKGNEETAQKVREINGLAYCYQCDISNRQQVYSMAEKVRQEIGNVDILINNAGIVTGKRFLDCSDDLIEKTMQVNAISHFWTVKAFLPSMIQRNHGHIVSIASAAGLFGSVGMTDYSASKFAAVGFNESLGMELDLLGKDGVFTTTVCPFYINTGMFDGVQTKYDMLMSILEPEFVVNRIMDAILSNQEIIMIPRMVYLLNYMKGVIPVHVYYYLSHVFGISTSMDTFKGRAAKQNGVGEPSANGVQAGPAVES